MKSDTYTRHRCEGRHTFIRTGEQKLGCDVMECVYCSLKVVDVVHPFPGPPPSNAKDFRTALIVAAVWGAAIGAIIATITNHIGR